MPNKENMQKWLDALRSGEYEQARGCLRDDKGFCCLGVACDVYSKNQPEEIEWIPRGKQYEFRGNTGTMPISVSEWLGVEKYVKNPIVEYKGEKVSVAELNDDRGLDFATLADLIEAKYMKEESNG